MIQNLNKYNKVRDVHLTSKDLIDFESGTWQPFFNSISCALLALLRASLTTDGVKNMLKKSS